jgi:hypothetical protein
MALATATTPTGISPAATVPTAFAEFDLEAYDLTTTTFGYSALQDRIWMRVHEGDQTVWLTRRMVVVILGPMVQAFENATPGQQSGAAAPARVAVEHELAMHETAPGQAPPQIRAGRVPPSEDSDPQFRLCSRISAQTNDKSMTMTFDTPTGPVVLQFSRQGMHLWLRGLVMVLKQTQWGMPEALPKWLDTGLMPPSIQALIDKPLPQDPATE